MLMVSCSISSLSLMVPEVRVRVGSSVTMISVKAEARFY